MPSVHECIAIISRWMIMAITFNPNLNESDVNCGRLALCCCFFFLPVFRNTLNFLRGKKKKGNFNFKPYNIVRASRHQFSPKDIVCGLMIRDFLSHQLISASLYPVFLIYPPLIYPSLWFCILFSTYPLTG